MVQLLQVVLYKFTGFEKTPLRLAAATDLASFSFWNRSTVSDHLTFATRTICQRTTPGVRASVNLNDIPYVCHVYLRNDGLCALVVSDKDYPNRTAFGLIGKSMLDFEKAVNKWNEIEQDQNAEPDYLKENLARFQDPQQADKFVKIQKNLDEIKDIMLKNIDEVLRRGETIETLMDRSNDLSVVSLQFYKKAKKTNQCCKSY